MPNFVDESLPKETLESMEQLRRNEELCDVELVVDQQCFRAHRVVLAASSMYFRAMFCRQMAESGQRRVVIQGVDADALDSLIKFSYTCSLEINEENAQSLLAASNFLQMLRAREACCKFLQERLDCSNCLDVADFAEFQSCQELLEVALTYARRNFTEVSKNERFCQISYSRMKHFLTSNDLHLPEGEEAVFVALIEWSKYNLSERRTHFAEFINLVKLPLLGQEFFAVEVAANNLVSSNEGCMKLIREAARALYNDSYPNGMAHLCRLPTQIPMKWWPRETLRAGEVIHILGKHVCFDQPDDIFTECSGCMSVCNAVILDDQLNSATNWDQLKYGSLTLLCSAHEFLVSFRTYTGSACSIVLVVSTLLFSCVDVYFEPDGICGCVCINVGEDWQALHNPFGLWERSYFEMQGGTQPVQVPPPMSSIH